MRETFTARPLPGIADESKRLTHLFEAPPAGAPIPERITALCNSAEFGYSELELLTVLRGMPCFACLHKTPRSVPQVAGTP
ncbi:hypothetical protein AB5J62_26050 [Amycolatopsis sp. cg5]|uniref:hypothetical protein n=1 Tax=Amycolatopsis sp. cg5 TaxID=3238802 RepID=UPI003523C541